VIVVGSGIDQSRPRQDVTELIRRVALAQTVKDQRVSFQQRGVRDDHIVVATGKPF